MRWAHSNETYVKHSQIQRDTSRNKDCRLYRMGDCILESNDGEKDLWVIVEKQISRRH